MTAMIAVVHLALDVELHAVEAAVQIGAFGEAKSAAAIVGFGDGDAAQFTAQAARFSERQITAALAKINSLLQLRLARIDVVGAIGRSRRRAGETNGGDGGSERGDGKSLLHVSSPLNPKRVGVSVREVCAVRLRPS